MRAWTLGSSAVHRAYAILGVLKAAVIVPSGITSITPPRPSNRSSISFRAVWEASVGPMPRSMNSSTRLLRQARIIDSFNRRVFGKMLRNFHGTGVLPFDSQCQRFHASQQAVGISR